MGMDADAKLFYGYVWDPEEDSEAFPEDFADWVDEVAKDRGLANPWDAMPDFHWTMAYPESAEAETAWAAEHRSEIDAYYGKLAEIRDTVGEHCDVGWYGALDGYSTRFIYLKDGYIGGGWDAPTPVSTDAFEYVIDLDAMEKLKTFAEAIHVDLSGARGPGWFLVASYG